MEILETDPPTVYSKTYEERFIPFLQYNLQFALMLSASDAARMVYNGATTGIASNTAWRLAAFVGFALLLAMFDDSGIKLRPWSKVALQGVAAVIVVFIVAYVFQVATKGRF